MQTFLPYDDSYKSGKCLDWRRLGKQRVEGFQILNTLLGLSNGWINHPAVKMWRGHEAWLRDYTQTIIIEWKFRGYKDTLLPRLLNLKIPSSSKPPWLGLEEFHASHRSNLLRKNPEHYANFGWVESPDLPYYWPI